MTLRPNEALRIREDSCSVERLDTRSPAFRLGPQNGAVGDVNDESSNPGRVEDRGMRRPQAFRLGPLNRGEDEIISLNADSEESSNSGRDSDCGTRRPPAFRLGPLDGPVEEVGSSRENGDFYACSKPERDCGSRRPTDDVTSSTDLEEQRTTPQPEEDPDSPSSGYCEKGSPDSPSSLPHPLDEYVENGDMNWEDVYDDEDSRTANVAIQCSMQTKDNGDFTFFCDWERPRNAIVQCNIIDGWLTGVPSIPTVMSETNESSFMSYLGLKEKKCNLLQNAVFPRSCPKKKLLPGSITTKGIGIQCLLGPRRGYTVEDKSTQVWLPTDPINPFIRSTDPPARPAIPQTENIEPILVTDSCQLSKAQQSKTCRGFHGFSSIRETRNKDLHLKSLCGLRQVQFEELLSKMDRAMCNFAPNREALLFLLMKLKSGLSFTNLGLLLGADRFALVDLFDVVVQEIHLRCDGDIYWPSRGTMKKNLPTYFKGVYEKTRVMLSFLELETERPENEEERARLFCSSSQKCSYKFILGWTPLGKVCFKSKPYEGQTSFSHIVADCGFLKLLSPSDLILTERIWPEMSVFPKHGLKVMSPKEPLNDSVDHVSEEVALHIERCTRRLESLRVLDRIPSSLFVRLDSVLHVCAVLINKWPPIVRHDQPEDREF